MENNPQNPNQNAHYVSTQEPPVKPPPVLETGLLKWVHENLFSSFVNGILTIVGIAIVIYSLVAVTRWAVQEANWHAVTINLRLLMVGRFEAEHLWRIPLLMLISSFIMGAAIAVWVKKIARAMLVVTVLIGIAAFILPIAINSNIPQPSFYTAAGNIPVVQGSSNEMPIESIAFIAQEGEVISVRVAENITDDASLSSLAGFIDRANNTLRNAASLRLDGIARYDFLSTILAEDAASDTDIPRLTANQRETYQAEFDAYTEVAPITEVYQLNQNQVRVRIYNAETMEDLRAPLELSAGEIFSVTIPEGESGWFILEKEYLPSAEVAEGITILEAQGISPLLQSSSFDDESRRFVDDFVRLNDLFRLRDPLPQIDGADARFVNIIENRYLGARSFSDYLSAYLAPFLESIGMPLVSYFMMGILGYWFTVTLANFGGKAMASNFAAIALALLPIIFWVLVNGLYAYSLIMWILVIVLALSCTLIFQIGRRSGSSAMVYGLAIVIWLAFALILMTTQGHSLEGYLQTLGNILTNPTDGNLWGRIELVNYLRIYPLLIEPAGVPRFILWIGLFFLLFAANSGVKSHIVGNENRVNWLTAGLALVLFVASCVLLYLPYSQEFPNPFAPEKMIGISLPITLNTVWPLEPTSSNDWGGLLLVMAITIYGIIVAFPIGVGLALGRRSDLPIIKNLCIAYIELVRGVPFITVLFFAQLLLPLINPELAQLTNMYRAIIATILFSAAYLAENVRGGLQSLPPGQSEAAKALGLSSFQMNVLITLPQALRAVIPALVGQFISLFKDTSLVSIVGLSDLVKVVDSINAQAAFSGTRLEGLFFISIIYFVFSYVMGYVSRLLEASGSGVTRRMG
jgi:His/Glu/Gln/Arg/opine family amino acid ABC transporter permease subunit